MAEENENKALLLIKIEKEEVNGEKKYQFEVNPEASSFLNKLKDDLV